MTSRLSVYPLACGWARSAPSVRLRDLGAKGERSASPSGVALLVWVRVRVSPNLAADVPG